jgi:hypothetical protein
MFRFGFCAIWSSVKGQGRRAYSYNEPGYERPSDIPTSSPPENRLGFNSSSDAQCPSHRSPTTIDSCRTPPLVAVLASLWSGR